jgi:hypothetical protein
MDRGDLEKLLAETRGGEPRKAAEIAYVIAKLYLQEGNLEKAKIYGAESIQLFNSCRMSTLEDCAALYVTLAGVALPSYIHQEVVRDRLKDLQL